MTKLYIIKIGGNVIDDEVVLGSFLKSFAAVNGHKILVHGGGKIATSIAEKLNIDQQLIDGRRITDAATLKVITMVYAGLINKSIVASLQANSCNALGLTGADGNLIQSHKRVHPSVDYGFVGDVDVVNGRFLEMLLREHLVPVVAPLTHDHQGQLLNTNADTIAQEISKTMSKMFDITLIYCFEKNGVLKSIDNENSVIRQMDHKDYQTLRSTGAIYAGMIPKLDNAFTALDNGIKKVIIGNSAFLHQLISEDAGTVIFK